MTAPTSPKPTTPADPNDLRTALTKFADDWAADTVTPVSADAVDLMNLFRDLLAAHPAPEMQAQARICPTCHDDHMAHQRCTPAPVSDTRREDDELVETVARALSRSEHPGVQAYIDARAVLAVLPAPPVVDEGIAAVLRAGTEIQAQTEAEVRERIAQDIEVKMRRHDAAQVGFSAVGDAYAEAARIARGATR